MAHQQRRVRILQLIIGPLAVALMATRGFAVMPLTNRPEGDPNGTMVIIYDPADGKLTVESPFASPSGPFAMLEIRSESRQFRGPRPPQLDGLFDVFNDRKLFLLDPQGWSRQDFGPVLPSGLTSDFLSNDLTVGFSWRGPKDGGTAYLYVVPEPSTSMLVFIATWIILACQMRTRR